MTFSGTIRGAIAFGLACSLELENELNRSVIVSGTLCLVLGTTLVFGALMPFVIKFLKSYDKDGVIDPSHGAVTQDDDAVWENLHPNFNEEVLVSKEKDPNELRKRLSHWIATNFDNFDRNYLKPNLLHNYPACITEHEVVSKKILEATQCFSKDKKNTEMNNIISDNEKNELKKNKVFNHDFE